MANPEKEYRARVNRVIDYIEANLTEPLPLSKLADIACFSRFHFHRIFRSITGETLNQFVQRLRLQKAASILSSQTDCSITTIALDCGFSGSTTFARSFKEHFGMSATQWRTSRITDSKNGQQFHKKGHPHGKLRQAFEISDCYIDPRTQTPTWRYSVENNNNRPMQAEIAVEERSEIHVSYVRHVGPYAGDSALFANLYGKLKTWAIARELWTASTTFFCVAHDDPTNTPADKQRISLCIRVPAGTPRDGDFGTMTIPGGKFAVGRFTIPTSQIADAWQAMTTNWLPGSGFQFDDRLCYEQVTAAPHTHPENKITMEIYIPIRPL